MARFGYLFGGGAPVMKRYKIGASFATKGVLAIGGATTTAGVAPCTTTSAVNTVGLTVDTGTYTTTQSATMTEGLITVIVNPDLVSRWRMSGTTASGGALLTTTNSVASAGGTAITITTGDPVPNSPTMLDGTILCISGANVLQGNNPLANAVISVGSTINAVDTGSRAVTTVTATVATVLVPYPNTIAVGDVFLVVPWANTPNTVATAYVTLTTALDEARANTTSTGAALRPVELLWDSPAGTGSGSPVRVNSFLFAISDDHVFNQTT